MLAAANERISSMEPSSKPTGSIALLKSIQALGKNTRGGLKILKKPSEPNTENKDGKVTESAQNTPLAFQNFEKTKQ